jgi:hypothetical protein
MYGRNFKPQIFTDITMLAKLFVAQILASKHNSGDSSKTAINLIISDQISTETLLLTDNK